MFKKQQTLKKIFFIFLLLLLGCNSNSVNWYSGSYQEALNENNQKIIMIDFYADW
tara:strand:+ start:1105 stop:1269 length:165 start_codon:yes stop_codon:yes gene_type:complete